MRRLFIFLAAALLLASALPAHAQGEVRFSTAAVELWPEFDSPDMLVIFSIELAPSVALPAELVLHLPGGVTRPHAVAVGATLSTVTDQGISYDYETGPDTGTLTIQVEQPAILVEYYDPALVKQGSGRSYVYTWPGDYAADQLIVQVKQPIQGQNFTSSLAMTNNGADDSGFQYFAANLGAVPAGEQQTLEIGYQRDTDALSTSFLQVQSSDSLPQNNSLDWNALLPWLLGGLAVILIVGGVAWYILSGKAESAPRARRRHARREDADSQEDGGDGVIYCHQCGKRAQPTDRFCRTCGSKLRAQ